MSMSVQALSEHYPLKQGLKLLLTRDTVIWHWSFRTLSTKTRIETYLRKRAWEKDYFLSEHYPLKQGLKQPPFLFWGIIKYCFQNIIH